MKTIVCVDKCWGIGKNNNLLFHLKEDMHHFVENTLNKVVVMGSNTLLSFPNGKPLKNRVNVVLWPDGKRDDVVLCENLDELSKTLKNYDTNKTYIIGGAMFYKTMLPYCDEALITKVDSDGEASVFFENLDSSDNWSLQKETEYMIAENGLRYKFCTYKNNNVKEF